MFETPAELILESVALPIGTIGLFKSLRDSKVTNGKYILWTVGSMVFVGITSPSWKHAIFRAGITLLGSVMCTLSNNFLSCISTLIVLSLVLYKLLFTDLEEEQAINLVNFIQTVVEKKNKEEMERKREAMKQFRRSTMSDAIRQQQHSAQEAGRFADTDYQSYLSSTYSTKERRDMSPNTQSPY